MNLAKFLVAAIRKEKPRLKNFRGFLQISQTTVNMKRDDILGLAGGGNKTRKLDFLVAEASPGTDTLRQLPAER